MKLFSLKLIILCFVLQSSFAQTKSLQSLRRELLCNVSNYKEADSATVAFLRANFPYLAKPAPQGGWVLPPFGTNNAREVVSMRFQHHPFFNFNIREGRVDFDAFVSNDKKYVQSADLWLLFDREADAAAAFQTISDTLSAVAAKKKMNIADNGQKTAEFSETARDNDWQVKLILKKDDGKGYYTICVTDADD